MYVACFCAVNSDGKVPEPKATSINCDIGTNVSQNGSVRVHDKAAKTKETVVDSEIGTKLNQMGMRVHSN